MRRKSTLWPRGSSDQPQDQLAASSLQLRACVAGHSSWEQWPRSHLAGPYSGARTGAYGFYLPFRGFLSAEHQAGLPPDQGWARGQDPESEGSAQVLPLLAWL
jgi:hypothetical protein